MPKIPQFSSPIHNCLRQSTIVQSQSLLGLITSVSGLKKEVASFIYTGEAKSFCSVLLGTFQSIISFCCLSSVQVHSQGTKSVHRAPSPFTGHQVCSQGTKSVHRAPSPPTGHQVRSQGTFTEQDVLLLNVSHFVLILFDLLHLTGSKAHQQAMKEFF